MIKFVTSLHLVRVRGKSFLVSEGKDYKGTPKAIQTKGNIANFLKLQSKLCKMAAEYY